MCHIHANSGSTRTRFIDNGNPANRLSRPPQKMSSIRLTEHNPILIAWVSLYTHNIRKGCSGHQEERTSNAIANPPGGLRSSFNEWNRRRVFDGLSLLHKNEPRRARVTEKTLQKSGTTASVLKWLQNFRRKQDFYFYSACCGLRLCELCPEIHGEQEFVPSSRLW